MNGYDKESELAPTRASLLLRIRDCADDASWREFFDIYYALIYGRVITRGVPQKYAEHIVAEIVSGVARGMPEFVYDPARSSFKTWLFRIVQKRVADYFRRRARELPEANLGAIDAMEEIFDDKNAQPDDSWEVAWKRTLAGAAFQRVRQRANPRYMQIYIYHVIEGHSAVETADHLQTTADDIYVAKHRIGEALRHEGEKWENADRVPEFSAGRRSPVT